MFQLYQIQWNDQKKIEILHLQIYSSNGSFLKKKRLLRIFWCAFCFSGGFSIYSLKSCWKEEKFVKVSGCFDEKIQQNIFDEI